MVYPKGGIAFFDSGIGGLTTLSACVEYAQKKNLNSINYFYYGDNYRAPYGNLPEKQISGKSDSQSCSKVPNAFSKTAEL